jgi:hypothetical protein
VLGELDPRRQVGLMMQRYHQCGVDDDDTAFLFDPFDGANAWVLQVHQTIRDDAGRQGLRAQLLHEVLNGDDTPYH